MSLLSYGVFTLGVVLGGMVLLVIFSLLAMAQKGDAYLDQRECYMLQGRGCAPSPVKEKNQITPAWPPAPICMTVASPKPGFSSAVESAKTLVGVPGLRFPLIRQAAGLRRRKPG